MSVFVSQGWGSNIQAGGDSVEAHSEYNVTNPVAAVGNQHSGNKVNQTMRDCSGEHNIGNNENNNLSPLVFNI